MSAAVKRYTRRAATCPPLSPPLLEDANGNPLPRPVYLPKDAKEKEVIRARSVGSFLLNCREHVAAGFKIYYNAKRKTARLNIGTPDNPDKVSKQLSKTIRHL